MLWVRRRRRGSWIWWLLALLGIGSCRVGYRTFSETERAEWRQKQTRFRQKLREAFAVWEEDDQPPEES